MHCPKCGRFMSLTANNYLLIRSWNDSLNDKYDSVGMPKLKDWVCIKEDFNLSRKQWEHR